MAGSSHDKGGFFLEFADCKLAIANDRCMSIKGFTMLSHGFFQGIMIEMAVLPEAMIL